MNPSYRLTDPGSLLSPSLLVFRDLARANLQAMIAMAGGPQRLRPHVKTHKMPALVHLAQHAGVTRHKCATIAEAEMIAEAGGRDVLIAFPIIGPNLARLARLVWNFPETTFRVTVDDPQAARALSDALSGPEQPISVLVDLDVGMGRTGIAPGPLAEALYALVADLPGLEPGGLHAYDGHLQVAELSERRRAAEAAREGVLALRDRLIARGLPVPRLVLGGTPTFPAHAGLDGEGIELSPGTSLLYDTGYGTKFADLPFTPAALLLTRVISRPRPGRICLDLGHKAVAADPAGPRVRLLDLPDATFAMHSEEHLVVETPRADEFPVGTPLLAIPTHICPTCALHRRAYVIENGELVDEWEVAARDRVIGV
jgi:D-serine deaminase-like pyridoxal phosphate-dependent protein